MSESSGDQESDISILFCFSALIYIKIVFHWYHRLGIRSLVLESADCLRTTGFALGIWPNGWRALDAIGVGHTLRQKHTKITRYLLFLSAFVKDNGLSLIHPSFTHSQSRSCLQNCDYIR